MKPIIEQLESRDTPSVSLVGSTLSIIDTGKGNIVTVTQQPAQPNSPQIIKVVDDGAVYTFPATQVSNVLIDNHLSHGNDILTNLTALPATILGGSRHDDVQSFGAQTTIVVQGGNNLVYDVLGKGNVITVQHDTGHNLLIDNVNSTVLGARLSDQVVPFFQNPVNSGTVFLDPAGNLFTMAGPNGSTTYVNQIGYGVNAVIDVNYNGTHYDFKASQVKTVDFFGGSGNDTFVNNTCKDTIAYGFLGSDLIIGGYGPVNLLKGANSNSIVVGRGHGFNDIGGGEIDGVGNVGNDILIDTSTNPNDILRYGPLDQYFAVFHKDTLIPLF